MVTDGVFVAFRHMGPDATQLDARLLPVPRGHVLSKNQKCALSCDLAKASSGFPSNLQPSLRMSKCFYEV